MCGQEEVGRVEVIEGGEKTFLMVLIIEACEAIRLLHDRLKHEFSILFREFDCTWAPITLQSFIARSFSKLHRVPHVILHLVVYILLRNSKMADRSLQGQFFQKNRHVSFIGLYCPTSIQQGKSFYMYL